MAGETAVNIMDEEYPGQFSAAYSGVWYGTRITPKETKGIMHYGNGRPANNGDVVVYFTGYPTKYPVVGRLHNAVPGNDTCNGTLLPLDGLGGTRCPNLADCVHFDDFMAAQPDSLKYPNISE